MQKDDFYNDGCHTFETRQFLYIFQKESLTLKETLCM